LRQKIVAGNWKMNLDRSGATELATAVVARHNSEDVLAILCPPSIYLEAVIDQALGSKVLVGAQNLYHEASGAFTGEVSPQMVAEIGCQYVILGHSERRAVFGESDDFINKKVLAALETGLRPIVCVGETLKQRDAGDTQNVIRQQFENSLADLSAGQFEQIVLAYEPVWAIGTGKVATPELAEAVHADLRKLMENRYNPTLAEQMSILYGGSVKPENAAELMAQPNIDGALVGGASLKADSFLAIINAA